MSADPVMTELQEKSRFLQNRPCTKRARIVHEAKAWPCLQVRPLVQLRSCVRTCTVSRHIRRGRTLPPMLFLQESLCVPDECRLTVVDETLHASFTAHLTQHVH
eukprot:3796-Eustigmatos_ZCMA.PRE.1